jgi:hypothetical protein
MYLQMYLFRAERARIGNIRKIALQEGFAALRL